MSETIRRRQGIHDENLSTDHENKKLYQCKACEKRYLVDKDGIETKLDEGEDIEWANLQKECDLENVSRFQCKGCKLPGAVSSPAVSPPGFCTLKVFGCICLLVTISCCLYFWINYDNIMYTRIRNQDIAVKMVPKTIEEEALENDLGTLEKLYSNQIEDTWITFSASIKSVIKEKPYKTSMFLLIFDSESGGKTAQCIAEDVSKPAIKYLRSKIGTPAIVNGEYLKEKVYLDDPGILLNELKEKVQENGALVVTNLQEVPPKVAQMFHFVCDSYAPLVEKYVTFFTLRVHKVPSVKDQQKIASETMKNLWSSLDDNELNPLITRMTTNIIQIYPDSSCSVF